MLEALGFDTITVAGTALALTAAMGLAAVVMFLIGPKPGDQTGEPDPRFTGESVGGEDEGVVPGSVRFRPQRRKITGWIGDGRVVALDAYGNEFVGKIVRKAPSWRRTNGGWALIKRHDCSRSVWCRLPAPI